LVGCVGPYPFWHRVRGKSAPGRSAPGGGPPVGPQTRKEQIVDRTRLKSVQAKWSWPCWSRRGT